MKKAKFVLFTCLLYLALAALTGVVIKMTSNYEPKQDLVYAKKDIPQNTVIAADMLEYKSKPLSDGHELAIKNFKSAVGKIANVKISNGEMLFSTRLTDPNTLKKEIKLKDKNNREFTVEFKPDQAVGWQIKVDQFADIIFVPNEKVIVNNIQPEPVQSVNKNAYDKKNIIRLNHIRIVGLIDEAAKLVDEKSASIPKYICFEVTKEQDQFLAWAKSNGRIEISAIQNELKGN